MSTVEEQVEGLRWLCRRQAHQFAKRVSRYDSFDEIFADALFGAWRAVEGFDPTRGVQLTTYAQRRIDGAILDGLRDRDHLPRTLRKIADDDNKVLAHPISLEWLAEANEQATVDIPDPNSDVEGELLRAEEQEEAADRLRAYVNALPVRLRSVVVMHYFRGMRLHEIAEWYGVTESRICQLEADAFEQIRAMAQAESLAA